MLKITNLTKSYPGKSFALRNVFLHAAPGDLFAFIGHNGAGKTTLIKSIVGIHDFDAGEIYVNGVSVREDPLTCKRMFAYVPDNPELYEYLTGIQYLNFVADVFGMSAQERTEAVRNLADRFELTFALGDLIGAYSRGMKQKLALIAALMRDPKLLILDEPFVGLDPVASAKLKSAMAEICQKGGAVFFSTHVLEVAEKLCNKAAIIKNGQIVMAGTMDEIVNGRSLESVFLETEGLGGAGAR